MLDKANQNIVRELKENSRQSVRDIAKKTNLRPSTVHLRMNKMLEDGIIEKFTLKLNNQRVGENFIVFILLNSEKDIPNTFFKDKRIKEVFGITGENDLLIKCKFKDVEDFNDFILTFRKIPGVKKTITMVATTTIKEEL